MLASPKLIGCCSSGVEHSLGKGEVRSSNLRSSTIKPLIFLPETYTTKASSCFNCWMDRSSFRRWNSPLIKMPGGVAKDRQSDDQA